MVTKYVSILMKNESEMKWDIFKIINFIKLLILKIMLMFIDISCTSYLSIIIFA